MIDITSYRFELEKDFDSHELACIAMAVIDYTHRTTLEILKCGFGYAEV